MSELRRYPDYKDSGVPWLGEIPSHWDEKRMRFFVNTNPLKSELDVADDTMISFLPMEALSVDGGMNLETNKEIGEVYKGYTYFRNDDVVIAKITPCFENGKASISKNLTNGIGFGTTELHVLRPKADSISKFIFYLVRSDSFMKIGESEMYGAGGQKRIPESFIKNFLGALPPLDEQQAIVNFLDTELEHIDTLISKQQQLIERLAEQRSAVITHAVTKGLDADAPMKDSGVEWLGDIPEHWDVGKIKHFITCSSGDPLDSSEIEKAYDEINAIPVIGGNGTLGYSYQSNFKESCISVGRVGALCGNVHLINYESWINDNSLIVRNKTDRYLLDFIVHILRARNLNEIASRTAQPLLTGTQVKNQEFCIPDIDEQKEIVNYIDLETKKIDQMSNSNKNIIAKLQEYRSALITQAVTGKIDVRDIVTENRIEEIV